MVFNVGSQKYCVETQRQGRSAVGWRKSAGFQQGTAVFRAHWKTCGNGLLSVPVERIAPHTITCGGASSTVLGVTLLGSAPDPSPVMM